MRLKALLLLIVGMLAGVAAAQVGNGAGAGQPSEAPAVPRREIKTFQLYATDGNIVTADGKSHYIWGYSLENRPGSATLPGPQLEVNEGDIVKLTLTNLGPSREGVHPVPHTVHLHGLDTNQENDGVPDTARSVRVGESFTYVFEATHAGTYWYHCHVDTIEHLTMGMYGAFVVHPAGGEKAAWTGGPSYDRAYTFLLSEMDPNWSAAVAANSSYDRTEFHPRYFFINGKSFPDTMDDPSAHVAGYLGENVFIRFINSGYEWRSMHMHGFHFQVIASDGRPLPAPYLKDTLSIGPGERYDILVRLDQLGEYPLHSHAIVDNLNDGQYPGGIHTMVTVSPPGGPLLAPSHGHGDIDPPTAPSDHSHEPDSEPQADQESGPGAANSAVTAPSGSRFNLGRNFGGMGGWPGPSPEPTASEDGAEPAGSFEIAMSGDRFDPEHLVVPVGSTVTWRNFDTRTHNIVGEGFESPDIRRNGSWSVRFDEAGVYEYECVNHRGMEGVITVR